MEYFKCTRRVSPYRHRLVREFLPGDEDRRFDFCNFITDKLETDPFLWTEECTFSRTGVVNRQNTHFSSLDILMSYDPTSIKYDGPLTFCVASGRGR